MNIELLQFIALFIVSLTALLKASDWFIISAERIGLSFGISPYIIGVTIIAFGTSLPELATSIASVYAGNSEIVVGNVIGSNITNILLVLGVIAVINKGGIKMEGKMIMEVDMPLLVISAILLWFTLRDGSVSYLEMVLYMAGLIVFLVYQIRAPRDNEEDRPITSWKTYALLLLGGVLVYFSADFTIIGIVGISEIAGVPSHVIALTAVALGTSLPELVVSVTAVRKGKTSMAVGNILGSNIFNSYAVMSIPRLFGDLNIPEDVTQFSLPFMVSITLIFTVISLSHKVPRPAGKMLLIFYVFFLIQSISSLG